MLVSMMLSQNKLRATHVCVILKKQGRGHTKEKLFQLLDRVRVGDNSCTELNGEKGDHDRFEIEPIMCDRVLIRFESKIRAVGNK